MEAAFGADADGRTRDAATGQHDGEAHAREARDDADRAVLEQLAEVEAQLSRLQARSTTLHALLARSALERGGRNQVAQSVELRSMAREVAARTNDDHARARARLEKSLVLTSDFPTLVRAQERGDVTAAQAKVIAREATVLTDGDVSQRQRDAFVRAAVAEAADRTPRQLRKPVRQLVEQVVSMPITARHERAIADRFVAVHDVEDGMAYLTAYLPAVQAHAIKDRLDSGAESKCKDDARTRDQWRADALSATLLTGDAVDDVHAHCDDPDCIPRMLRGIRARVAITVPMLSLAIDDPTYPVQPAMLDGQAPMSVATAAALVGEQPAMQRWLTHPVTGQVVAVDTRFASAQLAREVRARDGTRCRHPSCAATRNLQLDHNLQWSLGGATSLDNLTDLCPSCHVVKDSTGWSVRLAQNGDAHWTSRLGQRLTDRPIPPDIPLDPDTLPCTLPDVP